MCVSDTFNPPRCCWLVFGLAQHVLLLQVNSYPCVQVAIVFRTPEYRLSEVDAPVTVLIQLCSLNGENFGDPKPFQYVPNDANLLKWTSTSGVSSDTLQCVSTHMHTYTHIHTHTLIEQTR